ncbi:MAG: hypothetical protein U0U69_02215 [Acidimicrobiia bacterium]
MSRTPGVEDSYELAVLAALDAAGIKVDWDVTDFGAKVTSCGVIQLDNRSDHPGCGHYEAGGYAYSTQYWFSAYAENAFGRTTKDIQSTRTNDPPPPPPPPLARVRAKATIWVWDNNQTWSGPHGGRNYAGTVGTIATGTEFGVRCWATGILLGSSGDPVWYRVDTDAEQWVLRSDVIAASGSPPAC